MPSAAVSRMLRSSSSCWRAGASALTVGSGGLAGIGSTGVTAGTNSAGGSWISFVFTGSGRFNVICRAGPPRQAI